MCSRSGLGGAAGFRLGLLDQAIEEPEPRTPRREEARQRRRQDGERQVELHPQVAGPGHPQEPAIGVALQDPAQGRHREHVERQPLDRSGQVHRRRAGPVGQRPQARPDRGADGDDLAGQPVVDLLHEEGMARAECLPFRTVLEERLVVGEDRPKLRACGDFL